MSKPLHPVLNSKLFPILSAIGAAISLYQTYHFYQFRAGLAGMRAICDVSGTFSCSAIDASRFAELFAGIPLAAAASGWFIAQIVLWFWMKLDSQKTRNQAAHFTFLLTSGLGSAFGVVYLGIMIFILKKYCLFCLGVDAINFILLALCLRDRTHFPSTSFTESLRKSMDSFKPFAMVFFATLLVTFFLWRPKALPINDITDMVNSIVTTPPIEVTIPPHAPTLGPANAPITIVKFSDLQCPACRYAALSLHPILKKYPTQVRFVFRNFPLDSNCNMHAKNSTHPKACPAARVIQCANKLGQFREAYEAIFEFQDNLVYSSPSELAEEGGANQDLIDACIRTGEVDSQITQDTNDGHLLGVRFTPTFFINGHKIDGGIQTAVWDALIQRLLEKK